MMNRILSLVGWLGTAMVFVAVAIRFGYPAKEQWAYYLAWGGLVCVLAYTLGQWREIAKVFSRRQTRYGTLMAVSILVVLGILVAINYIGTQAEQALGPDREQAVQPVGPEPQRGRQARRAAAGAGVRAGAAVSARFQEKMKEYEYASKKISTEYIDPEKKPTVAAKQNNVDRMPTIVFNYKGRTERVNADAEQDMTNAIIKVVSGQQRKVYFTQGHGEKDTTSSERDGYNIVADRARPRELHRRQAHDRAAGRRCRTTRRW